MSEQHRPSHENSESLKPKTETNNEALKQHHEREAQKAENKISNNLEQLSKQVEKTAISGKEVSVGEREQPKQHPVLVNKQLKDMAFSRAMTRTRKKLSAPGKAFSKVIHTPIVDKSSEFIGKTVARPTSMLWGAVFAFFGTSALLWITRYYGYEYNYLLAILLFVGGALLGLAVEGLWRLIHKPDSNI